MDRIKRRLIISAYLGNLFEHYDTALFGVLSPFLAPLFFPKYEPITALILTYCMIPLGMLARPLGSLYFGYMGDRYGRKRALFVSLLGMGIISMMIAACPTFNQVGSWAPVLLVAARLCQNFFGAGETMGGAVYILERAPERRHDMLSSLFNATTIAGILLASAAVSLLAVLGKIEVWWRLLYLFGGITALFGTLLRTQDVTEQVSEHISQSMQETLKSVWDHKDVLIRIAIVAGFSYSCYSIALVMINGFIPLVTNLTKSQVVNMNTCLLLFDFVALPFFGYLATRFSREKMMLSAVACVVVTAIPLFMWLEGASMITVVIVRLLLVTVGVWFSASFHSWCQSVTPQRHRYTLISLGYAMGSQILGGPTAAISLWLYQKTQMTTCAAGYWILLALATYYVLNHVVQKKESYVY